jgi:hypothetical protein
LARGGDAGYHVKRALKYDVDPREREAALDALFGELGGDERALCDALYMTWDEARELAAAGFELGGHTVSHAILSRIEGDEVERELQGCAASLERGLGRASRVFAYPFGRRWDYDAASVERARAAGFDVAVNTHAGANEAGADRMQLARLSIDDGAALHLLAAEACGGFDLVRRLGVNLSE